jgi:hypothetical protein
MIKMVPVQGADKNSYGRSRPVMTCDGAKCDAKVEGNGGQDESSLKERAYSLGFQRNPKNSKDYCPDCVADLAGVAKAGEKGYATSK